MKNDFVAIATSKLAGVEIADRDYTEGEKQYFTWDAACAIEKKLNNGWRLPTRHEWALICEEFGQKDGEPVTGVLMENLGLLGWRDRGDEAVVEDSRGCYWSSTPCPSTALAYHLHFQDRFLYPSSLYYRLSGFPVRLVRDIKERSAQK